MSKIKRLFHTEDGIRISSSFGYRTSPITYKKEFHRGVDYATSGRKLPQYGLDDGIVIRCGYDGTGAIYAEVEYPKLGYVGQYYHLDRLAIVKGQKVNKNTIIGYTGNTGHSTGIHLHFGWYPISDKNISYYERKWSDFEKFNFDKEELSVNFGFTQAVENGLEILMYFQKNNLKLGAISAAANENEYTRLKSLKNLDDSRRHYCKVNAGYFEMSNKAILGQHYGVEVTPTVNLLVPKQDVYEVVYMRKGSDTLEIANSKDFYETNGSLEFALTPYSIIYHDGKYINKISVGLGNKERILNTQTFLIQLKSKQFILGCVKTKCYPRNVADWAKNKFGDNLSHLSLFDSGGSTQMIVAGEYKLGPFRDIANCLTFYEVNNTSNFESNSSFLEDSNNNELEKLKTENIKLTAQIELLITENKKLLKDKETLKEKVNKMIILIKSFLEENYD